MTAAPLELTRGLALVAPVAMMQHGLFTLDQALAAGLRRGVVDRRVRDGELVIVDERVYRSALTPPSWHQRVLAACLVGPAVASHRTGGAIWRAPGANQDLVEVTSLRHRRRKVGDVVWHESYLLDELQITAVDGIPVTTPTRTVVDLGAVIQPDELTRVLDDFSRRRLTSPARVARLAERLGHRRPGFRCVEEVVGRRLGRLPADRILPESDLETVFENLVHASGLPMPERQVRVPVADGRTFRIDFAYSTHRLGIEVAGSEFHATPERWAADIERMTSLAAVGWLLLVFTDAQVRRTPETVVDAIRRSIARLGVSLG